MKSFIVLLHIASADLICEDGYTCYEDTIRNVVWVKNDDASPACQGVCEGALLNNADIYHSCDDTQPLIYDMDSFNDIATGLNFTCKAGGCWDSMAPGQGIIAVKRGSGADKTCYFPDPQDTMTTFTCTSGIGNANCYGERYSNICPCIPKPFDEACEWTNPPNVPKVAQFVYDNADNTSCINRINYWRKRACEEDWIECPPAGLPPMTECTCCHDCANSQAEYDKNHKAHASFKRCGDMVQGEGGGANCARVIDMFVSERKADENGTMRCQGHCGPIVKHGCQTFFWGEYNGFHTLNWRTCNVEKCNEYCSNPTDNSCFSSHKDIAPDVSECPSYDEQKSDGALTIVFAVFFGLLVVTFLVANVFKKMKNKGNAHVKAKSNKGTKDPQEKETKKKKKKEHETTV
eukprot:115574_1